MILILFIKENLWKVNMKNRLRKYLQKNIQLSLFKKKSKIVNIFTLTY